MTAPDEDPRVDILGEPLPGEVIETCRLCNVEGGKHHRECPLIDNRDWTES